MRARPYRPYFTERLGFLPESFTRTKAGSIWLHAVSVGEVSSVIPLIRLFRTDRPLVPVYLSTSTVAGRKAAMHHAAGLVDGIFYAPIDYASRVRKVLRAIRPSLVVVLETEIWPNLYAESRRFGARLAIVNGRISERTWPRYRAWKRWFRPVLDLPDLILVQTATDVQRYTELGGAPERIAVAPNLKYDASFALTPLEMDTFGSDHVWIAASTVGPDERGSLEKHSIDEDDVVLDAFERLSREFPKLLLILAPRQPARFDEVEEKLKSRRLHFLRRSESRTNASQPLELPGVLLLDTMGELSRLYHLASVSFVGGTLAPRGGHNILEPAAAGSPIVIGPHMENFESIARDFVEAGAVLQLTTCGELLPAVRDLLTDRERGRQLADNALRLVRSRRGRTREIAEQLWRLYYASFSRDTRTTAARLLLRPLAGLWKEGGIIKRWHSEHFSLISPPLTAPVISIGGITVGGSGKTPFAVYLINRLEARGHSPALLTRGYGRRWPAEVLVFAPGARVPAPVTGDEAQIFLHSTNAPVGIGAKRYETGQILLRQYPATDVLVLDDGFQHARIERNFDIVLIDGLDPFGGEEVVPLGRLREPLDALRRADAFVVTRAENTLRYKAIKESLRKWNPAAPTFRTRLVERSWHDYRAGHILPSLAGRRVGAFCGIGNPESFWQTLEALGLQVVFRWQFPDHHVYRPAELQRVAHQARLCGADILVTTEKDRINCPSYLERVIKPLDLAWLAIDLQIEDEVRFFDLIENVLARPKAKRFAV